MGSYPHVGVETFPLLTQGDYSRGGEGEVVGAQGRLDLGPVVTPPQDSFQSVILFRSSHFK